MPIIEGFLGCTHTEPSGPTSGKSIKRAGSDDNTAPKAKVYTYTYNAIIYYFVIIRVPP